MSKLVEFAKSELALLGTPEEAKDPMNKAMNEDILALVSLFASQGHSGGSAGYAVGVLERLMRFEPLKPLTGEPDEWSEAQDGPSFGGKLYQNKRCSRVFKDSTGAYDVEGRVFRDPDGCTYVNADSRVPVEFPYRPKTEVVDRP